MKSELQEALDNFKKRCGVSYEEYITSKEAQLKARKKLDETTLRLRKKYYKKEEDK